MLEGRHGGLVGTKALGEASGPCCMGMMVGLCLVFHVIFCKPVNVVEGISLKACCCSDGGVSNVGVGGGWHFSKGVGMFITNNVTCVHIP